VTASNDGRSPSSGFPNCIQPQLPAPHFSQPQSESESELVYDWRFTANQFVLATSPFRPTTRIFIFLLNTCGYIPYVTSSLTRGWSVVYNCCWFSPAQSFSSPSPARFMTTFYCLRFETPPTWRARFTYLCPPGTGWPSYTPSRKSELLVI
jgi:hypothetical protein